MGVQLDDQPPLLTPPGEGETVTDRPERTLRILGELDELIVTWFRYEPGEQGPDAHIHQHHTDAFYVLEGELELSLGPELTTFQAEPGDFAGAPPGVVHTFRNASDSTVVFLNLHVPSSGFGDHIRGKSDDFDQLDPPPARVRPARPPRRRRRSPRRRRLPPPGRGRDDPARDEPAPGALRPAAAHRDRHALRAGVRGRRPAHPRRPRGHLLRARGPDRVPRRRRATPRRARDVRGRASRGRARVPRRRARADPLSQPARAARRVPRPPAQLDPERRPAASSARPVISDGRTSKLVRPESASQATPHVPRWLNQRPTSSLRNTTARSPPASTTSK